MPTPYEILAFFAWKGDVGAPVVPPLELRLLHILQATARASGDPVGLTLLADRRTDFPGLDPRITLDRQDIDPAAGLMLARTVAEVDFLERFDFARPVAMLDTDIVVNGPIGELFDEDFDVAVCYRRRKGQPINAGAVFLGNRRPEVVRDFMRRWLATYRRDFADQAMWWGDQAALNALLDLPRDVAVPSIRVVDGVRVRLLEPGIWNYAPRRLGLQALFPKRGRKILHYKSKDRKPDMIRFYERWFDGERRR